VNERATRHLGKQGSRNAGSHCRAAVRAQPPTTARADSHSGRNSREARVPRQASGTKGPDTSARWRAHKHSFCKMTPTNVSWPSCKQANANWKTDSEPTLFIFSSRTIEGGIAETLDLRSAVHGRPQVWTAVKGPSMVVHKVWTATIALSAGVARLRRGLTAYLEKSVHTSMVGSPNFGCLEIDGDSMYRCLCKYTFVKIGMDGWTEF
jgi:hypothetical protein